MTSRAEVAARYAKTYAKASKKERGRILDQVVDLTGWSRDNARRRLTAAAKCPPDVGRSVAKRRRKPRSPKYSPDTLQVLQKVWAASGEQCGKYLVASMRLQLDGLERHGELMMGHDGYSEAVREQLLAMSAASIDRYLRPAKVNDQKTERLTTKPSLLLRSPVKVRQADVEIESAPGLFNGEIVAHCGPTLTGEFARTLNLTCVHTGWTSTRTVSGNAHTRLLSALETAVARVPFEVFALDFGNGPQFLNKAVIGGAGSSGAGIESKHNHLVRKYAFYYRYDTPEEFGVLNRLWPLVNDRLNYLTPTIKPIGYTSSRDGRRRRLYDAPKTPQDRLLAAGTLSPAQQGELIAYRDSLNPANIARQIADLQQRLVALAKEKTERLYLTGTPTAASDS